MGYVELEVEYEVEDGEEEHDVLENLITENIPNAEVTSAIAVELRWYEVEVHIMIEGSIRVPKAFKFITQNSGEPLEFEAKMLAHKFSNGYTYSYEGYQIINKDYKNQYEKKNN